MRGTVPHRYDVSAAGERGSRAEVHDGVTGLHEVVVVCHAHDHPAGQRAPEIPQAAARWTLLTSAGLLLLLPTVLLVLPAL